jgi:amidohydrolase
MKKIYELCQSHFDDIVAIRRDIHQYPEIEFDVHRTAAIAAKELEKLGATVKTGIGKTGVVGDIEIPGATKRIALRADMDALPMQELGNPSYKSKIDGKAHMCGHDVHTAMLIGAARVLTQLKDELKTNVRFIFQPSEEKHPGGAPAMMADGALDSVDEIYGMHVWPLIEAGQFAICPGPAFAQSDSFEIEIHGKGGHAAFPHLTIDPVMMGSQFVTLVQSVVGRNIDPLDSAVISVTQFHGGSAHNVIPPSVRLAGTVRTLKKEVQAQVRERLETLLSGITAAHGGTYDFFYQEGYPVTYNHQPCADNALAIAKTLVDEKSVHSPYPPVLGGEDFGYYSQEIPACFIFLGAGNREKGIVNMCHDPRFDVDEQCIIYGMAMHVSLALNFPRNVR